LSAEAEKGSQRKGAKVQRRRKFFHKIKFPNPCDIRG
jgi:hypothetical protein